jgi:hypothetical protein
MNAKVSLFCRLLEAAHHQFIHCPIPLLQLVHIVAVSLRYDRPKKRASQQPLL